jgi:4-hydroxymandelate synthase
MKIDGFDHLEFYVRDVRQSAAALCDGYGFAVAGQAGPQTGQPGQESLLLRQGRIQLLLTQGLHPGHPAAAYTRHHGDGVAVVALRTSDAADAFAGAVAGGAQAVTPPALAEGGGSRVLTASVTGFGDVVHTFVERSGPGDQFAPGAMRMRPPSQPAGGPMFDVIDHLAVCLPGGGLAPALQRYATAFGLDRIFDERIDLGGQSMISTVVQDPSGQVTFTLIEPDLTRDPGQIDDFLRAHDGAGVQHVALHTADIIAAVRALSGRGVEFLTSPGEYYASLAGRLGSLGIGVDQLRAWNVLADRDAAGQMFQIFARSVHERHTFFYELIERRGALTFGSQNIRALYEALEAERTAATLPSGS